jgi:FkbM family methyltransferase
VFKQLVRRTVNGLGFQITRLQSPRPTPYEIQKMMIGNQDGAVIFDVGAHTGAISKTYRELFPNAVIHAFEPTPSGADRLRTTFASDHLFHVHEVALSDSVGEQEFHINESGSANSLLSTDSAVPTQWSSQQKATRKIAVRTATIDALCAANGISRIDALKIDVQGSENKVLRGAQRMLNSHAIKSVYVEMIVAPSYVGQSQPGENFTLLYAAGLRLFDLCDIWRGDGLMLLQFDALFALPECIEKIGRV